MDVEIDISFDLNRVDDGFGRMGDALAGTAALMDEAATTLYVSVLRNFAAEGRPKPWDGLSESTVRRKGHAIPLVDTGSMLAGIHRESGPGHASVAVRAKYAVLHHAGTEFMPARPFMLIQDEDRAAILDLVRLHMMEAI